VTKPKRRRPSKKLATTLASLADALPELEDGEEGPRDGKIRHKSLKSRKGAMKKKEKVVKGEMERFGASMARLAETGGTPTSGTNSVQASNTRTSGGTNEQGAAATSNRWAALRGYISATMEQSPAFAKQA
jgi:hypothetical protein